MSIMPVSQAIVTTHHGDMTKFSVVRESSSRTSNDERLSKQRPGRVRPMLLLIEPEGAPQLIARWNRRWVRLMARLRSSSLDRRLADGYSPESSRLLAARAQVLVSSINRQALAQSLENILLQARKSPTMRDPRVRLNRGGIIACEVYVQEMQNTLLTALPISARGVATMNCILGDGMGPLYNHRCSTDLRPALTEAIAQLDPFSSL
jgi:hypothetical protein